MEYKLDITPAYKACLDAFAQTEQFVLNNSKRVAQTAEKTFSLCFGGSAEFNFTVSALGTLAVSQFKPQSFWTIVGTAALTARILNMDTSGVDVSEELALTMFCEDYPKLCEGKSKPEIKEEYSEQISTIRQEICNKTRRSETINDLALTNMVSTLLSQLIFDSAVPAMLCLSMLSAVRLRRV